MDSGGDAIVNSSSFWRNGKKLLNFSARGIPYNNYLWTLNFTSDVLMFCSCLFLLCTELTLFCIDLPKNCIHLNQSELINFFMYLLRSEIIRVISCQMKLIAITNDHLYTAQRNAGTILLPQMLRTLFRVIYWLKLLYDITWVDLTASRSSSLEEPDAHISPRDSWSWYGFGLFALFSKCSTSAVSYPGFPMHIVISLAMFPESCFR